MKDRSKLTAQERKDAPLYRGLFKYFPDALMAVAQLSKVGNDQHNPGQPLHWAKEKSTDEGDALLRHQLDAGTLDTDGQRHSAKVAWRALAQLQREIEAEQARAEPPTAEEPPRPPMLPEQFPEPYRGPGTPISREAAKIARDYEP